MEKRFIKGVQGYKKYIADYLGLDNSEKVSVTSDFEYSFNDLTFDAQIEIINKIIFDEFFIESFLDAGDILNIKFGDWKKTIEKRLKEEQDENKLDVLSFIKSNYWNKLEKKTDKFLIDEFNDDFWRTDEFMFERLYLISTELERSSEIENLNYISKFHNNLVECIFEADRIVKSEDYLYLHKFFERLLYFYKSTYDHLYIEYGGYMIKLQRSYSTFNGINHSLKNEFNFDENPLLNYDDELGFKLYKPINNHKYILQLLTEKGYIKKGTILTVFKTAFSNSKNKKIETPLIWLCTKRELNYLISELVKKEVIDNNYNNYQKHWEYCKAVFRDKDGNVITNLSGNNKIPNPSSKSQLDIIIRTFL